MARENEIIYGAEAREALKKGIDTVANAVKVTLGAKGRNVLISNDRGRSPHITKDGVTVAKSINVTDPLERQGALLIKEVAETTNSAVGDGTTSTTVLTQKMCNDGLEILKDGNINVNVMRQGMLSAMKDVSELITAFSIKVESQEDVKNIASVSANNDEFIGGLISEAYEKIGRHGVIAIDSSENTETYIKYVDGYQFDRGLITPYFITEPNRQRSTLENPYIIVTDHVLNRADEFKNIMDKIAKKGRPVLIICDDMEFACVQDFLRNHVSGYMKMAVVKAPEFGERRYDMLQDICTVTGATFVSKERGNRISELTLEDLGEANSAQIDMENTTIVGGQGSEELIAQRVEEIKSLSEGKKGYELEVYEKRLGKITGGAAVIHIGAKSEVDLNELKDRVEDALNSVKASVEQGILIGGGAFLYRIGSKIYQRDDVDLESQESSFRKGYDLVIESLKEPMITILKNGEISHIMDEFDKVIKENDDTGVNVVTGQIVNMFESGIVDPAKVVRSTVENAVSVASTLLLTEVIVLGDDYSSSTPQGLSF